MAQQSPFLDVSSEFQPELTDIQRKQRLAQLLTERGMQAPQGQVVSGRYVAPNPMQYLSNLFNVYQGQNLEKPTEERQQALAKLIREQGVKEATGIMEALAGTPAQQQILGTETPNLPIGQTAIDNEGNPTLVQPAREAQAPNTQLALARALSAETPAGRALLPSVMERAMPKDFDLEEGKKIRQYFKALTFKVIEGKNLTPFLKQAMEFADLEYITSNLGVGTIASLPATYAKMTTRDDVDRKIKWAQGGFIGKEGDKVIEKIEVIKQLWSANYNTYYFTGINDKDQVLFFAYRNNMEIGDHVTIEGKVKSHRDNSTQLSHVKVIK